LIIKNPENFFIFFEGQDHVVGLSFADESEAKNFYQNVIDCKNHPPSSNSNTSPSFSSIQSNNLNKSGSLLKKEKKNPIFNFFFKKKKNRDDILPISEPTNFRHVSSIGWNPQSGFEICNIPPEWKELFIAAKIKKSELKDPETAKFLVVVIEQNTGYDFSSISSQPPPSPPNMTSRGQLHPPINKGTALPTHEDSQSSLNNDFGNPSFLGQINSRILNPASQRKIPPPPEPECKNLVNTLIDAMKKRRPAMQPDDEDEDDWSAEWSY